MIPGDRAELIERFSTWVILHFRGHLAMLDSFLAAGYHNGAGRRGLPPLGWRTGVLLSVLQSTGQA